MGKSLAEVHALERARWDALVPATLDDSSGDRDHGDAPVGRFLAEASGFLGELRGRRILEYGCGLGDLTLLLARRGAHVTCFDLSPRSIEHVRRQAQAADLADRVQAHVAPAERLPFFDESFELVLGKAILHCLVPELSAPELHRVLRPGGRAAFLEPVSASCGRATRDLPRRRRRPRLAPRELEAWTTGFSSCELRTLAREPGSGALEPLRRLGALGRRRRFAMLLLTR